MVDEFGVGGPGDVSYGIGAAPAELSYVELTRANGLQTKAAIGKHSMPFPLGAISTCSWLGKEAVGDI